MTDRRRDWLVLRAAFLMHALNARPHRPGRMGRLTAHLVYLAVALRGRAFNGLLSTLHVVSEPLRILLDSLVAGRLWANSLKGKQKLGATR